MGHWLVGLLLKYTVGEAFILKIGNIFLCKNNIFVTSTIFKLQTWFLHWNGVEFHYKLCSVDGRIKI